MYLSRESDGAVPFLAGNQVLDIAPRREIGRRNGE